MKISFFKKHFDLVLMTGLYTLSFGLSLLNVGVFWDDWMYFGQSLPILIRNGVELGIPWLGYFQYVFTRSVYGIVACRFLVFFSFLLSGFCLFYVIKSIHQIPRLFRLLICIFFLIFPIHYGRMLICVSHYAVCFFLFFLALALLCFYLKKRNWLLRLFILLLFVASFFTSSLLVFYFIAILVIFYHDLPSYLGRFLLRYLDFFILPISFYVARHFLFSPHGLFDKYNQINFHSIVFLVTRFPLSFKISFFDVLAQSLSLVSIVYLVFFGLIIALIFTRQFSQFEWKARTKPFIFCGFFLFFLGVSPYLLVGKLPLLSGWEHRHQLLLGLGSAVLLSYGFFWIIRFFNGHYRQFIILCSVMIGAFVLFNIHTQLEYHRDLARQDVLIHYLAQRPQLGEYTTILFDDLRPYPFQSRYSFYEYAQFLSLAYGGHSRLGVKPSELKDFDYIRHLLPYAEYGYADWTFRYPQIKLTLYEGVKMPPVLKLIAGRLFLKDRYLKKLEDTLVVSTLVM